MPKYYVTKYALTQGIIEVEGQGIRQGRVRARLSKHACPTSYALGKDVFRTLAEAKACAVGMAQKEVQRARRALEKAELMYEAFAKNDIKIMGN